VLLFVVGAVSFHYLPVEAYPDVANNYVEIITQWPGISAEQIEQQVTIPLEIVMNGVPHVTYLRSFTLFGLSDLKLIFDDQEENAWNRERVLERLSEVTLPNGVAPQIGTDWSPVGQIYFFTLHSTNPAFDVMELKTLEDWVVEKSFKSVPNVVDVASFGGPTREYQVRVDPNKLIAYGLSLGQVEQQLTNNNANAGGSFIEAGLQQINVSEVGLVRNVADIENTVIMTKTGTPVRIKDIAVVAQGPKIRLGQFARAIRRDNGKIVDNDDVVSGIVLLRKGAEADATLRLIEDKVRELNEVILPRGVKVVPFLDRSDLVHFTTHTVLRNLTEGISLVIVILFLFLGNVRGAIIVALTIPFSLLFAATCLTIKGIPANLLSLGALDFGMVVDGAVVMVENIIRHLGHARLGDNRTPREKIFEAAHEVQRPVFYAIGIIITAYLPIFTLQAVEGRLFKPMAWTVAFALLGALTFSVLVAPVLASLFFPKGAGEWHNPVMTWLTNRYRSAVRAAIRYRWVTAGVGLAAVGVSVFLARSGAIGSEFLPHLDEGALWVRGTLAPSTGPTQGIRVSNQARLVLCAFPEVIQCTSQTGRPDDGTDSTSFFNTEYFVDLKPKAQWRPAFHESKDEVITAMDQELEKIPGVVWSFSQPIADNMEEAVSGVKGQLATKVYGDDLKMLEQSAQDIVNVMRGVKGIEDLGVLRSLGQPNDYFEVDRQQAARYQINVADVQDAIQTAVGGNALTQVLQGEQRYDLVMRYLPQFRDTREAIENIRLLSPSGERVSLAQLTRLSQRDGASEIYRERNQRYVAIKYSVRGRDLGGAVEEAIQKVHDKVESGLPRGYYIRWEGEYVSEQRAATRLMFIVPLTILLIFLILYSMFRSFKWASLILINVALAPFGGMLALLAAHTNFSVSSGIGFLALFGVSVQTGVIMLEYINQLRARGHTVEESAVEGAVLRLRPILMTMLVATLGLLPAATSHEIGSDSQRPFAIVIVGGLIADLVLSVFLLPAVYVWAARNDDVLPVVDAAEEV
jgi:heavy metal efflux system protein